MSDTAVNSRAAPWIAATILVIVWEALSSLLPAGLFPHLPEVARAGIALAVDSEFLRDIGISLRRAAFGYLIGSGIGIFCGIATATRPLVGAGISPILSWARPLPPIALAPFLIL